MGICMDIWTIYFKLGWSRKALQNNLLVGEEYGMVEGDWDCDVKQTGMNDNRTVCSWRERMQAEHRKLAIWLGQQK